MEPAKYWFLFCIQLDRLALDLVDILKLSKGSRIWLLQEMELFNRIINPQSDAVDTTVIPMPKLIYTYSILKWKFT